MSTFATQSERKAAIAAISSGQFSQIGKIFDELEDIDNRVIALQESAGGSHSRVSHELLDVSGVSLPSDDAKISEIREVLTNVVETVNQILNVLKNKG